MSIFKRLVDRLFSGGGTPAESPDPATAKSAPTAGIEAPRPPPVRAQPPAPVERSAEEWLALARENQARGETQQAIAAFHRAIDAGDTSADAHYQLGLSYAELSDHARAERHLEQAVELAEYPATALCALGTLAYDRGRFGEAVERLERALAFQSDLPEIHFNLGLAQFELGRFADAASSFSRCIALNRGAPWDAARRARLDLPPAPAFSPQEMAVNTIKLKHDCEQLEYLLARGELPPDFAEVLADYRELLREIDGMSFSSTTSFDPAAHPLVARTWKRPLLIADVRPPEHMINPALDFAAIEERYLASQPNILAVDELLAPDALAAVREFCLRSTIWNNILPGYLGAYFYDGFCSELLLRLAWELRARFPRIFRGLPLQMMWGYRCDCTLPGLGVHADAAAVNVNFWITEDEANLDPERGGLLVWPQTAPPEWGFSKFNVSSDTIRDFLESTGAVPVRVPYRANRAVIFDSDLFHASDQPSFRPGYTNRRTNITLLYGSR
jgi:hypothetical protein